MPRFEVSAPDGRRFIVEGPRQPEAKELERIWKGKDAIRAEIAADVEAKTEAAAPDETWAKAQMAGAAQMGRAFIDPLVALNRMIAASARPVGPVSTPAEDNRPTPPILPGAQGTLQAAEYAAHGMKGNETLAEVAGAIGSGVGSAPYAFLPGGELISAAAAGGQSYEQSRREAYDIITKSGVAPEEADKLAHRVALQSGVITGTVTGAFNKWGPEFGLGKGVERGLSDTIKEITFKELQKHGPAREIVKGILKETLGEATEEATDQLLQESIVRWQYDPSQTLADSAKAVLKAGVLGGIAGGVIGGPGEAARVIGERAHAIGKIRAGEITGLADKPAGPGIPIEQVQKGQLAGTPSASEPVTQAPEAPVAPTRKPGTYVYGTTSDGKPFEAFSPGDQGSAQATQEYLEKSSPGLKVERVERVERVEDTTSPAESTTQPAQAPDTYPQDLAVQSPAPKSTPAPAPSEPASASESPGLTTPEPRLADAQTPAIRQPNPGLQEMRRREADRPPDFIDWVSENIGKIRSKSKASEATATYYSGPGFESAIEGSNRNLFSAAGSEIDIAAQQAFDAGQISDSTPDAFFEAIGAARTGRQEYRQRMQTEGSMLREQASQSDRFSRAIEGKRDGKLPVRATTTVDAGELFPGDTFKLAGEDVTVKRFIHDPETDEITGLEIQDGRKFGTQTIGTDHTIQVDSGSMIRSESSQEGAAGGPVNLSPDQPFSLKESTGPITGKSVEDVTGFLTRIFGGLVPDFVKVSGDAREHNGKLVEGSIGNGAVTLYAPNLRGEADIRRVLRHELLHDVWSDPKVKESWNILQAFLTEQDTQRAAAEGYTSNTTEEAMVDQVESRVSKKEGRFRTFISSIVDALNRRGAANYAGAVFGVDRLADSDARLLVKYAMRLDRARTIQNTSPSSESFSLGNTEPDRSDIKHWVSTRQPTAVNARDNLLESMVVGSKEILADTKKAKTVANIIGSYDSIKDSKGPTASRISSFQNQMADNLEWLYHKMPPEIRERARLWYDGARRLTEEWSKKYEVSRQAVAGVIAVLSPKTDWYQNVDLGRRVIETFQKVQDMNMSKEMRRSIDEMEWTKIPEVADAINLIGDSKFNQIETLYQKAVFIRLYDQTYNSRSFPVLAPEGKVLHISKNAGSEDTRIAWQSFGAIGKAIRILEDPSRRTISLALGNEHKVRNFFNNILVPWSDRGDVTIDTHAVAAALLMPLAALDAEPGHNFGSGSPRNSVDGWSGTYGIMADAYRMAAEHVGVLPRELQSITWEAVRGLFTDKFKTANNKELVRNLWREYKYGRKGLDETRTQVLEAAGGISAPSWHERSGSRVDAKEGPSNGPGNVSETGVSGQEGRDAGSGGGSPDPGAVSQSERFSLARETVSDPAKLTEERTRQHIAGRAVTPMMSEMAHHGLEVGIEMGVDGADFSKWSKRMVNEVGPGVRPFLTQTWDNVGALRYSLQNGISPETQADINRITKSGEAAPSALDQEPPPIYDPEKTSRWWMTFVRPSDVIRYFQGNELLRKQSEREYVTAKQRAAINTQKEGLFKQLEDSFYGDNAGPIKRALRRFMPRQEFRKFMRLALPIASYLNVTGGDPGSFTFTDFEMHSGFLLESEAHKASITTGDDYWKPNPVTGELETLKLGPKIELDSGAKGYQLLRPMPADRQAAVYEWARNKFPQFEWVLNTFMDPRLRDTKVTIAGVDVPIFNRHALAKMYAEGDPQFKERAAYTPEVSMGMGLVRRFIRARQVTFREGTKSPGRKYETGTARETGNVLDLLSGFNVRAMQGLQEEVRRKWMKDVFNAATEVPKEGLPVGWTKIENAMAKVWEAAQTMRKFDDPINFPQITERLRDDESPQYKAFFGELIRLKRSDKPLMLPERVVNSLLQEFETTKELSFAAKLAETWAQNWKAFLLLMPGTFVTNRTDNYLRMLIQSHRQLTYAAIQGGDRLAFRESRKLAWAGLINIVPGMRQLFGLNSEKLFQKVTERVLVPEVFEGETGMRDFWTEKGTTEEEISSLMQMGEKKKAALTALRDIGPLILQKTGYGSIDVAAKQQFTFTTLLARAEEEAFRRGLRGDVRDQFIEHWMLNPPQPAVLRAIEGANRLMLRYSDAPGWLGTYASIPALNTFVAFPMFRYHWVGREIDRATSAFRAMHRMLIRKKKLSREEWSSSLADTISYVTLPLMGYAAAKVAEALKDSIIPGVPDDDDEDPRSVVGASSAFETTDDGGIRRKALARELVTSNRLNISRMLRSIGVDTGSEQDYWWAMKDLPVVRSSALMYLSIEDARAHGPQAGIVTLMNGWKDMLSSLMGIGQAVKVPAKLMSELESQDSGRPVPTFADPYATNVPLSAYLTLQAMNLMPGERQANEVIKWLDPVPRRITRSKELGYDPGVVEALQSEGWTGLADRMARGMLSGDFASPLPAQGHIDRKAGVVDQPREFDLATRIASLLGHNIHGIPRSEYKEAISKAKE